MHLLGPLTSLTLLFTTIVPSIVATPVEQSSNDAALEPRAGPGQPAAIIGNRQCSNPAQINLLNDPGINALAGCGWKMWAACTAIAGGACFLPCLDGGFIDPLCDGCIAALGALGCHSCVENRELQSSLQEFLVDKQDRITQKLQSQYCIVPKAFADVPQVSVKAPTSTIAAGASTPVQTAAAAAA